MIFKTIIKQTNHHKIITVEKNFDSIIINISLKCNFTIHKNLINYARHIQKHVTINECKTFVIIDSKISKNFIAKKFIDKHNLKTQSKKNLYELTILNENSLKKKQTRRYKNSIDAIDDEKSSKKKYLLTLCF